MRPNSSFSLIASACLLSTLGAADRLAAQVPSSQPTLKVLYTFKALGGTPTAIVEVSPGTFLGTTATSPGLFSITIGGNYQFFYTFPPNSSGLSVIGLTPALNGQTYGASSNLGPVTTFSELFSIAGNGKVTAYPYNGTTQGGAGYLVQGPDNYLYGFFGVLGNPPAFTRFDYQGKPTSLYTFSGTPELPLIFQGADGSFYGLSLTNSTSNGGIFRLTPAGSFSWLVPSFPTNGVTYDIALMQAGNGNFYGTLPEGGTADAGSIYQVTPSGTMTTLYEFSQVNLGIPETLLEASDGMLYGTARGRYAAGFHGYSSIFRLNPTTGQFQTIFNFRDQALGECECSVVQGSDGKLYGVTEGGGTYQGGTIWVLDAGLPPPKPRIESVIPQAGAVDQRVLLWGKSLLGATAVSFNGTAAGHFAVASSQGVWAWVPSGATTGPITITTPNGSFTTTQSFTIE
ncbi:MAG: choice-of-anchor tandem repeat GloVer-containing protein [Bryobacteraceae bacterium]|jgi:uncharacterized repeat protein (TIGR03803 family)